MPRHIPDKRVMVLYHAISLGSVRAAADKLGVAPSSVSRQIAQLESELAMVLIERRQRGIRPTEAGEILVAYYRERIAQTEAVEVQLDELQGLRRGHITLAMGEGFVGGFFPETLKRFNERHPNITIEIGVHGAGKINELLVNDEVHIGLSFNSEPDANIQLAARHPQPMLAMMSPDHPLAQLADPISMAALADTPVAFTRESFGIQKLVRRAETEASIRLNPTLRANSISMIREFARANLGVIFLPRFAASRDLHDGSLVARPVQSNAFQASEAQIILRRGRRLPYAGEKLLTLLSSTLSILP